MSCAKTWWRRLSSLAILGTLAASSFSCGITDYYSQVVGVCKYQIPYLGMYLFPEERIQTTLTPECKAALEAILPYDSSFDQAPPGFKDKVTEAFQAIIAYPLAIPVENKLFGAAPPFGGAIPTDNIDHFRESDNPNQSIFNFVMNNIDTLEYSESEDGESAKWHPGIKLDFPHLNWKRLIITRLFALNDEVEVMDDVFQVPFLRASTLIHEARHGDGRTHEPCSSPLTPGINCDPELNGPYGLEITYLQYLLHGSAVCEGKGCKPLIPAIAVEIIGAQMVGVLKDQVNSVYDGTFKALHDVLADPVSMETVSANWVLEHEGLPTAPYN